MFYFDTNTVFPTCVDMFSRDAGCVKLKGMHYYRHTCVSYTNIQIKPNLFTNFNFKG